MRCNNDDSILINSYSEQFLNGFMLIPFNLGVGTKGLLLEHFDSPNEWNNKVGSIQSK